MVVNRGAMQISFHHSYTVCIQIDIYIYIFTICRFNLKTFAWEIGYIQIISNIIKTYDNYACEYQSWLFIVWLDDLWEYLLSKLVEILKFWMPQLVTCFSFPPKLHHTATSWLKCDRITVPDSLAWPWSGHPGGGPKVIGFRGMDLGGNSKFMILNQPETQEIYCDSNKGMNFLSGYV